VNRVQNPGTGRWTSPDPKGFAAGDANIRRYVGNDPANASDPKGLDGRIEWGVIVYGGFYYGPGGIGPIFVAGGGQVTSPWWQGGGYYEPNGPGIGPVYTPTRPIFVRPLPTVPLRFRPLVGPPYTDPWLGRPLYPLYYPGLPYPIPGILCKDGRVYPSIGGTPKPGLSGPGGIIYLPSEPILGPVIPPPEYAPR
jgi:hypothetical protein